MSDYTPPPPFALSDSEKSTPLWMRLKAHMTEQLDAARNANDAPASEQDTAMLRGKIRCLKALISLGKPGQMTGDEDEP